MATVLVKRSIDVVCSWHLNECFALTLSVKGPVLHGFVHSEVQRLCHANEPQ